MLLSVRSVLAKQRHHQRTVSFVAGNRFKVRQASNEQIFWRFGFPALMAFGAFTFLEQLRTAIRQKNQNDQGQQDHGGGESSAAKKEGEGGG
jgi:hypothetical protein